MDLITFLLVLAAVFIVVVNLFAIYWYGSILVPVLTGGAPYVPSQHEDIERMLELAQITPTDVVVDLGSGDGRLVIAAAQAGAGLALGYEIHPGLVTISRNKISSLNLERAAIHSESMWGADLSRVTVVLMYQVPYAMNRLKEKLQADLPKGARIISNAFEFSDWDHEEQLESVRLYRV
jgi:hypothetical protein